LCEKNITSETKKNQRALELLNGIASGNELALSEFYDVYHANIYNFALKRLSEPADAADVLNDVMLQVWKNAKSFQGRAKVMTWVFGITHHKVIDKLRKRTKQNLTELDPSLPDENNCSAIQAIAGIENAEFVKFCLEKLTDAHRQIVHLAFFEEYSYPEIAQIVECPEGTVKTRMYHAKQGLKRCLAKFVTDGV
jgi:RNA polymerase sigma-70 factor (ECF subfamily)